MEQEKFSIHKIHSEILGEDLLLVEDRKDLPRALRRAEKEGLVLYTPHEVEQLASLGGEQAPAAVETIRAVHLLKKEFDAHLIEIGGPDDRREETQQPQRHPPVPEGREADPIRRERRAMVQRARRARG